MNRHKAQSWLGRLLTEFKKDPLVITILIPIAIIMVPIWILMDTITNVLEVSRKHKTRERR